MTGPQGYAQLADELRSRIMRGEWRPGDRMPSETDLMQTHGLARETVRRAIAVLRAEGLVEVRHGRPSRVRRPPERAELAAEPGTLIFARPATPADREAHSVPEGWPMLVVRETAAGVEWAYPADRYAVRVED